MAFSPINASKDITEKYTRYLSTIFSLQDPEFQKMFEENLRKTPFFKGPFLEITDAFQKGPSILELIEKGDLPKTFDKLGFHCSRSLYQHQVDALHKLMAGDNAVVSTGTGSGKTESFLIPILRELVLENNAHGLTPGVRAMMIYPMNALANDQIERLREVLKEYPEITFGSYTGQTAEYYNQAIVDYRKLNGGREPQSNELISREQMKKSPPHILITNYAMLEYLMVRPDDAVFFDARYTRFWKYIVLDEAHVYKGSTGIEVAMLLRRLKAALGHRDIQYILTSATLGNEEDNEAVATFAQNLCDSSFYSSDIIRAKRSIPMQNDDCAYVDELFYHTISKMIEEDQSPANILKKIQNICPTAAKDYMEALYHIVYNDLFYWKVRSVLREPATVEELIQILGCTEQRLTEFVTVATKAVYNGAKLFDARYHMFLRAVESVFVTFAPRKHLFLEARKTYTENNCTYKVFEIATCNHCHAIYILGRESEGHILEQATFAADQEIRTAYLVSSTVNDSDDEHTLENAGQRTDTLELCTVCGALSHPGDKKCDHHQSIVVQKVTLNEHSQCLTKCAACEHSASTGVLRQFFVGQEAVTSVIGTALFENLPSYKITYNDVVQNDKEDDWGFDEVEKSSTKTYQDVGAKQFIAFSDSRQAAAFYSTYLDQTYQNIVYKRLVVETLSKPEYTAVGKNLDDFVEDLIGMFEYHGMSKNCSARKEAWKAALHEVMDNNGITSLYNMGLICFDIAADNICGNSIFGLSADEMHEICALFVDWMMSEGAVRYPEVMNRDERSFYAHNGIEHSYTLSNSIPEKFVLSFIPSRSDLSNKRLSYLEKVLTKKGTLPEKNLVGFLEKIWERFFVTDNGLLVGEKGSYKIQSHKIIVQSPKKLYRCKKCHRITPHNVENICPAYRCDGELEEFDPGVVYADNHYYRLYREMEIRPLRVVEHTAQLDKETAYEYQQKFKNKELDILSCSTTFEMGVDVGSLETVFMRNVPPSPANYAQRAGRAGRSLYSAAFALTFCNRSNHDFSFFRNPIRMIKGQIVPPVFNVSNPKIAIRHIYATAFSFFWKKHPKMFSETSIFMEQDGVYQFEQYLHSCPDELKQYIENFLPVDLIRLFDVEHFGWVDRIVGPDGVLSLAAEDYRETLRELEEAKNQAVTKNKLGVDALTQRIHVFQRERILAYLARKNIFPKYGFPVDTVEMRIQDHKGSYTKGLALQRDLTSAISEYAPGAQIVANGKLITSRYIKKMPDRSWKMSRYHICSQCGDLNLSFYEGDSENTVTVQSVCGNCGAQLDGSKFGVYLIPEFGFEADGNDIRKPGLKKPLRTYRSEVSYVGGITGVDEQIYHIGSANIYVRSGKFGELAVLNRSRFYVCEHCGYTELDEKRYTPTMKKEHKSASGRSCSQKMLKNFSLAYRFKTDVLLLRFSGMEIASQEQALSIMYGILEGASRVLEVERDEISGCLKWFWNEDTKRGNYGFVFYDKTPGGAGHVRRLQDECVLKKVLYASLEAISKCTCGGSELDTSCYGCLRNYYNQKYHEVLQRRYVLDFLREMFS